MIGHVSSPDPSRVQQVTQAVPGEVERQDEEEDGQSREETQPRRVPDVAAGRRKVCPPRGNGGLRPETEKRQRGLVENGKGEAERDENDDRAKGIGEDLAEDDPRHRGANRAGRQNVVILLLRDHRRARDSGELRDSDQTDRDDRALQTDPGDGDDRDGHEQHGKREEGVDDAAGDRVGPTAEIAREESERDTNDRRDTNRHHGDRERDARAIDHATEDIATLVIGAEKMIATRGLQQRLIIGFRRVVRGDNRGKERRQDEHQQDRDADREGLPLQRARQEAAQRQSVALPLSAREREIVNPRGDAPHQTEPCPILMRGSRMAYRMSTSMLMSTIPAATTSTTPWITG